MAARRGQRLLDLSDRLYGWLLRAYPASFRRAYGADMAQLFRDHSRAIFQQYGWRGLPGLWLHTLGDFLTTIGPEYLAARTIILEVTDRPRYLERSQWMSRHTANKTNAFGRRLAEVLNEEPIYYRLLTAPEPTPRMSDVIESLALEGDLEEPDTMLSLFQALAEGGPETHADHWLKDLQEAARQIYQTGPLSDTARITDRLVRIIYMNPQLYDLIAAVEPGYGLQDIIESLVLEGDVEEVETMLQLMAQLQLKMQRPSA